MRRLVIGSHQLRGERISRAVEIPGLDRWWELLRITDYDDEQCLLRVADPC